MPQRKLKIKKNESSKENRELLYLEYLKTMNKKREYETFKNKVYSYLISYQEDKITKDCGCYKGEKHAEFLPENCKHQAIYKQPPNTIVTAPICPV